MDSNWWILTKNFEFLQLLISIVFVDYDTGISQSHFFPVLLQKFWPITRTLLILGTWFYANKYTFSNYLFQVNVSVLQHCYTMSNLSAAAQYFIFVTTANNYGSSLPSVRALAQTLEFDSSTLHINTTAPNVQSCCAKSGVLPQCLAKLCDVSRPPSPLGAFDIALNCRAEFPKVAPCLADGT